MKRTHLVYRNRQSGMAVLLALMVLVVMTLAAIGIVRSVDSGALIAGNLAFRKSAANATDFTTETARAWLIANAANLMNDNYGLGYSATAQDGADLTGNVTPGNIADDINWPGSGGGNPVSPVCSAPDPATGNRGCYVIHRLCQNTGPLDGGTCSTRTGKSSGQSLGGLIQVRNYQPGGPENDIPFGVYRVTVRVDGPRNTQSFAQMYVII